MTLLTIDGVAMPAPVTGGYKVTKSDLDSADSGRSETGVMQRNRVRKDVTKIEYSAEKLTATELSTVLSAIAPERLSVSYFFGTIQSADMYVSDRSCNLIVIDVDGSSYWDVSFSLIEF